MDEARRIVFALRRTGGQTRRTIYMGPRAIYRISNQGPGKLLVQRGVTGEADPTLNANDTMDMLVRKVEVSLVGDEDHTVGWYEFITTAMILDGNN
jgi:hypothetical protein